MRRMVEVAGTVFTGAFLSLFGADLTLLPTSGGKDAVVAALEALVAALIALIIQSLRTAPGSERP